MPLRKVRNYDVLSSARKSDDVIAETISGLLDTLAPWGRSPNRAAVSTRRPLRRSRETSCMRGSTIRLSLPNDGRLDIAWSVSTTVGPRTDLTRSGQLHISSMSKILGSYRSWLDPALEQVDTIFPQNFFKGSKIMRFP
jgi:hypothetical protein